MSDEKKLIVETLWAICSWLFVNNVHVDKLHFI